MTYGEAITYLYDRLPVFHRAGVSAYRPGLANALALCAALGDPQHSFRSIHVAGTNGKGSTSHLLASVYQSAGYRVGLYTSPHLTSFTERIRLNGVPIAGQAVADFVSRHQALIEAVQPSFFEVTVAMAFDFFARQQVDVVIVEVGLGGRLDSTNIITPLVSVITNIGFDHMDVLGDTLPRIAVEKGGIIKSGIPVVIGESQPETLPVFARLAAANGAPLYAADAHWLLTDAGIQDGMRQVRCCSDRFDRRYALSLPLLGLYQLANLRTVLTAIEVNQSVLPVTAEALDAGCRLVVQQTGLRGRFQLIRQQPMVIADTAHNRPGMEALLASVASVGYRRLRVVAGFVRDKDVSGVLALLPVVADYYFCQADSPRALPVDELVSRAVAAGRSGRGYADVNLALAAALVDADPADLILITGSTYVVAELIDL